MKLPPLVVYSVLRLLAFLVPLGVLLLFPIFREFWWLAIIFAAIIGMSISLVFLRAPLSAASTDLYQRKLARTAASEDTEIEDAANEAAVNAQPNDE